MFEPESEAGSSGIRGDAYPHPFLSIVIPAFNEEGRLPDTLSQIVAFLESQSFITEVILVDNASTDLTKNIVTAFASRYPFIKYLYEPKRGKGAAVRTGVFAGRGDYLLICDADLAVPIQEVRGFLPPQCNDFDVAIGSREIEGGRRYHEPFYRHLMGRVFNLLVQLLVLPGIRDTQCGFKCFRRKTAHHLFATGKVDGWGFDVEILCVARLRGYRIVEIPVNWHYGEQSKVSPIRDTWHMLKELMVIRKNREEGVYDKAVMPPST